MKLTEITESIFGFDEIDVCGATIAYTVKYNFEQLSASSSVDLSWLSRLTDRELVDDLDTPTTKMIIDSVDDHFDGWCMPPLDMVMDFQSWNPFTKDALW